MKVCLDKVGVDIYEVCKVLIYQVNEKMDWEIIKCFFWFYCECNILEGIMFMSIYKLGNSLVFIVFILFD